MESLDEISAKLQKAAFNPTIQSLSNLSDTLEKAMEALAAKDGKSCYYSAKSTLKWQSTLIMSTARSCKSMKQMTLQ